MRKAVQFVLAANLAFVIRLLRFGPRDALMRLAGYPVITLPFDCGVSIVQRPQGGISLRASNSAGVMAVAQ
jgi:hypothetical protein